LSESCARRVAPKQFLTIIGISKMTYTEAIKAGLRIPCRCGDILVVSRWERRYSMPSRDSMQDLLRRVFNDDSRKTKIDKCWVANCHKCGKRWLDNPQKKRLLKDLKELNKKYEIY
jgi:hypothetical protein